MKILITGGTGLVGSNVLRVAQEKPDIEVIATLFSRQPKIRWDVETVFMDLEDEASIRQAVQTCQPDAVIHCAAPRDEDRLEVDHSWGWQVMVAGTRALAEACCELGARLIFVSSDWVFGNGGQPPYREDSPPCPVNYFGFLKAIGETVVSFVCKDSAVVRIAGVYGPNWSDPHHEPVEGVGFGWLVNYYVHRLSQGKPVVVWMDHVNVWANPSLASDIAGALLTIAEQDQRGLFHCCGRDSVSRLELAQAVADVFGFDRSLVRAAQPEEMDISHLQGKLTAPYDSRLSVTDSETRLGRINMGLIAGLQEFRRQLEKMGRMG
ncbi:MAG: SDR family oxidoreductase [Anaerolineae bacterium]